MFRKLAFRSFGLLPLALLAAIVGAQERSALVGRLQVDRSGNCVLLSLLTIDGRRRPIDIPPNVIAGNNGLDSLEGRWLVAQVRFGGRRPAVSSLNIVTADSLAELQDPIVKSRLPDAKTLASQPVGYSGPVNNLYEAIRAGWAPRQSIGRLEQKGETLLSDRGFLGMRLYVGGDARHYFLVSRAGTFDSTQEGVFIDEIREDNLKYDESGALIYGDCHPVLAARSKRIWQVGSTFRCPEGSIQIKFSSASASTIVFRPASSVPAQNVVTNTSDQGAGSLRNAIAYCNTNSLTQVIFNIPKSDDGFNGKFFTIKVPSMLPAITSANLQISGATQTTFTGDTNPDGPAIYLEGTGTDPLIHGIRLQSFYEGVDHVAIGGFSGDGINLSSYRCTIKACYLGLAPDGKTASPNESGINGFTGAIDCLIGGAVADRNVISGNLAYGIGLSSCPQTYIRSCFIGTDATGKTALPNGADGINIGGDSSGSVIGGSSATQRNVISSNHANQINIENWGGVEIKGNYIGTDVTGNTVLSGGSVGIYIVIADNIQIGGTSPGEGNVIVGHSQFNIKEIDPTNEPPVNLMVLGNLVGVNAAGSAAGGPTQGDISLSGAIDTQIGDGTAAGQNVISGAGVGITLASDLVGETDIFGNKIGTDLSGSKSLGNTTGVLDLATGSTVLIGGAVAGQGNLISGNGQGIDLQAQGAYVEGNRIGLNLAGTAALPNGYGVVDDGTPNYLNVIGSSTSGGGNIICGNTTAGVFLNGCQSAMVLGNAIGILPGGVAMANGVGVWVQGGANNNVIGGILPNSANTISGNLSYGIYLINGGGNQPYSNVIEGNRIGLDQSGKVAVPNHFGIMIRGGSNGNFIGGAAAAAKNYISGNLSYGLYLGDAGTSSNSVQGNLIGVNALGAAVPNGDAGLVFGSAASSNYAGTTNPNTISYNKGQGVRLTGPGTSHNFIQKNILQGNVKGQVLIDSGASLNTVTSNTITATAGPAAIVVSGVTSIGNNLRQDIFNVGDRLLVDLIGNDGPFGVTPNDPLDADTGPNDLQNNADITAASLGGSTLNITGNLLGKANTSYTVDLYLVDSANSAGHGGKVRYLSSITATTDGTGKAAITGSFASTGTPIGVCTQVTAANGDTSEFGANKLF